MPARLVVSGHPSIERVVLTLNAGDDVQTATFGSDGGEATMALATTATGEGQVVGSTTYNTIFAVGTLLFVITLVLNMISIRLVRKYREVYE